jgi:hypothetical protein
VIVAKKWRFFKLKNVTIIIKIKANFIPMQYICYEKDKKIAKEEGEYYAERGHGETAI